MIQWSLQVYTAYWSFVFRSLQANAIVQIARGAVSWSYKHQMAKLNIGTESNVQATADMIHSSYKITIAASLSHFSLDVAVWSPLLPSFWRIALSWFHHFEHLNINLGINESIDPCSLLVWEPVSWSFHFWQLSFAGVNIPQQQVRHATCSKDKPDMLLSKPAV